LAPFSKKRVQKLQYKIRAEGVMEALDREAVQGITTVMLWVVIPLMVIVFLASVKSEGIKEAFKAALGFGGLVFVVGWVFLALDAMTGLAFKWGLIAFCGIFVTSLLFIAAHR
jgi:predicted permease